MVSGTQRCNMSSLHLKHADVFEHEDKQQAQERVSWACPLPSEKTWN